MSLEIEEFSGSFSNKGDKNNSGITNAEMLKKLSDRIDQLEKEKTKGFVSGNDNQESLIKNLAKALRENSGIEKKLGDSYYVSPEDIDPNDVLDPGVSFYSHKVMFVISSDKRQGMSVRTPFGDPIVFSYQSTRRVGTGREAKLHNLSVYTSFSKKEVEWLKSCRDYGSIFFDNHTKALSVDSRKADKLARIMGVLNTYSVNKIVNLATQNDIPQSTDPQVLKLAIANKQADTEISKENSQNEIRIKESIIESELLSEAGNSSIRGVLKG